MTDRRRLDALVFDSDDFAAFRNRLNIDTSMCRTGMLGVL